MDDGSADMGSGGGMNWNPYQGYNQDGRHNNNNNNGWDIGGNGGWDSKNSNPIQVQTRRPPQGGNDANHYQQENNYYQGSPAPSVHAPHRLLLPSVLSLVITVLLSRLWNSCRIDEKLLCLWIICGLGWLVICALMIKMMYWCLNWSSWPFYCLYDTGFDYQSKVVSLTCWAYFRNHAQLVKCSHFIGFLKYWNWMNIVLLLTSWASALFSFVIVGSSPYFLFSFLVLISYRLYDFSQLPYIYILQTLSQILFVFQSESHMFKFSHKQDIILLLP